LERYDEALVPLMQAAQLAPEDAHVRFALAWCYKRTGRIDLAIRSLERVLATEPGEALVHYNLACYWSLAGDKDRALEFLSEALEIDPNYRRLIDEEPDFDPIRSDPRFQALCAESGAAP
jgi:Flp pilus assembly protein TadD